MPQPTPLSPSLPTHPPIAISLPAHARAMSPSEISTHTTFMREALSMATHALHTSETPVGCIFVHIPTSTIIARGWNQTNASFNGTRHAEFVALNEILGTPGGRCGIEVLKECELYVTVEPCIMCASLLRQVGVRRVWFGAGNEKFGGTGGVLNIQSGNGRAKEEGDFEVSGGWGREEAIVLLRRFYVQENGRAPEEKRGKEGRVLRLDVEPLGDGKREEKEGG
ncbi:cytidine deaminase-like protein [Mollisia scopiformis]|uniref:Cytidine deaminase-like protein n=1 Tax=Mollisia scopiformis TaxID=149040 RepID=A0A132BA83_MOLSC|nr:cytidine deaminase-like protein [Mollisia scopiformis]KUJ09315.1 cytidine deaminase-like protein [Mollisia scopiformis]